MPGPRRAATVMVPLPGGQSRLRQVILYVAGKCEGAKYFGAIKLNKIIWKADFDSFAGRGVPVTGREYRRQKFGPALWEMRPVLDEMASDGAIHIEAIDYGDDIVEHRTIALDIPNMSHFSVEDIAYIDASVSHYWEMTGVEASDESHGIAWKTRFNGDKMPYDLALLSDEVPQAAQMDRLKALIRRRELTTQ